METSNSKVEWNDLITIIHQLPKEEKEKHLRFLQEFNHDIRQNIGIIYASEALLRRQLSSGKMDDPLELLNAIQIAHQQIMALATDITNALNIQEE